MKLNLLELTQLILSSLDSDEVNSINDTTESRQVVQIIRTAYYNIISRADPPELKQLFTLDPSGSSAQPALMLKPENVTSIEWIKYNKASVTATQDHFDYVTILPLTQFLDMIHQLNPNDTDVDTLVLNGTTFYFKNALAPTWCTIVDDFYIVFDSYDSAVDTTLQSVKSLCYGLTTPAFAINDTFIPELDEQQFPLLINEAKSLAFMELKQMAHEKAEQESRRQWRSLERTKALKKPLAFDEFPTFGRK